jgi:hypothetical protein
MAGWDAWTNTAKGLLLTEMVNEEEGVGIRVEGGEDRDEACEPDAWRGEEGTEAAGDETDWVGRLASIRDRMNSTTLS